MSYFHKFSDRPECLHYIILGGMHYVRVNSGATVNIGGLKGTNGSTVIFINSGIAAYAIISFVKYDNSSVMPFGIVLSDNIGIGKDQNKYNNVYFEDGNIYIQGKGGAGDCFWAVL